jgi:hypothetical protein
MTTHWTLPGCWKDGVANVQGLHADPGRLAESERFDRLWSIATEIEDWRKSEISMNSTAAILTVYLTANVAIGN